MAGRAQAQQRGRAARILVLAMLICAALPMAAHARPSVVVDVDMSFDDAATLAYLAQADRHSFIDLDAVTVSLSGAGYAGRAWVTRAASCARMGCAASRCPTVVYLRGGDEPPDRAAHVADVFADRAARQVVAGFPGQAELDRTVIEQFTIPLRRPAPQLTAVGSLGTANPSGNAAVSY